MQNEKKGMVADRRRDIESGQEFVHLFPPPAEEDKTIKGSASVEDTMALIQKTVPLTMWHTEKISSILKGPTLEETCENIWHFVYNHIQYKRDKDGVEQVRSPRRTWWERSTGVDCDCYTEFISSILLNLNIPHKARITKYRKRYPEVPHWQHVYPIVPKPGRWHKQIDDRDDYIVIDCVKDEFDSEQPFLECKDFDMRLDYLDGIEEEETHDENIDFVEYDSVDLVDLASIYDDEEMGNIFKKIGGAVKTAAQKVGSAVKTAAQNIKATAPVLAKKVGDEVGKGIRVINKYANPVTILLRNGFLLAMKINLMNVAGRLRYGYLTDAQAQSKGINLNELKKLRTIKDRAETVYWQAGGKKENLKKGILSGKGNKDKKVPLSGFEGVDGLDNVYADYDEYRIIHGRDDMQGLGEIASGTAIAAATSAVAAIAAALKQVKGLFNKGGSEEQAFQSETDNAGTASTAPATIPEDEDAFTYDDPAQVQQTLPPVSVVHKTPPPPVLTKPVVIPPPVTTVKPVQRVTPPAITSQVKTITPPSAGTVKVQTNETAQANKPPVQVTKPVLSNESATRKSVPVPVETATTSTDLQTETDPAKEEGFFQKSTTWVKQNPGKSLLVAGGIITGGYLLSKAFKGGSNAKGLSGVPKKREYKKGNTQKNKNKKNKVKPLNLL